MSKRKIEKQKTEKHKTEDTKKEDKQSEEAKTEKRKQMVAERAQVPPRPPRPDRADEAPLNKSDLEQMSAGEIRLYYRDKFAALNERKLREKTHEINRLCHKLRDVKSIAADRQELLARLKDNDPELLFVCPFCQEFYDTSLGSGVEHCAVNTCCAVVRCGRMNCTEGYNTCEHCEDK